MGYLGRSWGRLSVEGDPQYDGQDIKDEDINSGNMVLMGYINSIFAKERDS